ncbi:MAG: DUF5677 domain-containing protein [Planctomycetota bacterium]
MDLPEVDRWFWRKNVAIAKEIGRAIQQHVMAYTPTTRALEPLQKRMSGTLDTLTALHRFAKNDWCADGRTLLRTMYDAHLQALYILHDAARADERAQLFLDFRRIEQRAMQKIIERNPTRLAKKLMQSPKRLEGEAEREANYRKLRPKFLTKDGKKERGDWYPGTLRDLARQVVLESEYEILQKDLSASVHSTPSALLAGSTISEPEHLLLLGWKLMFRVLGRIAAHHGVSLATEHEELVRDAMSNIYDFPADEGSGTE